MRFLLLIPLTLAGFAGASETGYDLSLGAEVRGGQLKVAPTIAAPPGKKLRYEVVTIKSGRSGQSDSRQSGNVTIPADGTASLSQMNVSVTEADRYEVTVKVHEGQRLVAAKTFRHPQ